MKKFPFLLLLPALMLLASCHQAQPAHTSATTKKNILTPAGDTIQKVIKSDAEWQQELSEAEFKVLRKAGTERAFSGEYWDNHKKGTYHCRACGFPLFDSDTKFDSGTGWPSYYQPLNNYCISEEKDTAFGMVRTEVLCARCDSHLGHVFDDGPAPTGLRYCINSVSLKFEER